jgi:hypothetical protein
MASLKIRFENMFLLVRSAPAIVLSPNGGAADPHTLTIRIKGTSGAHINATGADFTICTVAGSTRTRWFGTPAAQQWPDGRILDFETLGGGSKDAKVKKVLHSRAVSPDCPQTLNARFYLPYGNFDCALGDKDLIHLFQQWSIPLPGAPNHAQYLIDCMEFEHDLDSNARYELEEVRPGSKPIYHALQTAPGKDVELTVSNRDTKAYVPSLQASDFKVIYDCAVNGSQWPMPKKLGSPLGAFTTPKGGAVILGTGSSRPICGVGGGDPEP